MIGMTPSAPYQLGSLAARDGEPSVLAVGDRPLGGGHFALIAGPCTVETRDQTLSTAQVVKDGGATMLRGGAYKPRTSPYAFQGLGEAGLRCSPRRRRSRDCRSSPSSWTYATRGGARGRRHDPDRRAQHAELRAADRGRAHAHAGHDQARPVEHDRGAADGGGIRPQGGQRARRPVRARDPHVRDRLSLHARPRRRPGAEIAQPSAGRRRPVARRGPARPRRAAALAAAAAGADGIVVEVHPEPDEAVCDGPQSLRCDDFARFAARVHAVAELAGQPCSMAA